MSKLSKHQVKIAKDYTGKVAAIGREYPSVPQLIANVAFAPPDDFAVYALQASEVALDDLLLTVSILSGIDVEELENEAGIDEIVNLHRPCLCKHNNIDDLVKNGKCLLPMPIRNKHGNRRWRRRSIYTIDDFSRDCAVTLGVRRRSSKTNTTSSICPTYSPKHGNIGRRKSLRRMQMLLAASGRQLGGGIQTIYYCDAKGGRHQWKRRRTTI
ncbi:hypothetical protein P7H17_16600 [Paenibacillus larvae]|nr:hypothetical protein [Paenibacillus larvae]MDT2287328.1 hypothetical protein [Paenibacillus larvae]